MPRSNEKKKQSWKGCVLESYRETVVDIFGAGFCHAGISQVYLIKYDRLERYKQRVSGKPGQTYSKHWWCYPPLSLPIPTSPGSLKTQHLIIPPCETHATTCLPASSKEHGSQVFCDFQSTEFINGYITTAMLTFLSILVFGANKTRASFFKFETVSQGSDLSGLNFSSKNI